MEILGFAALILVFGLIFGSVDGQTMELSARKDIDKFTKDIALHPEDADAYLGRGAGVHCSRQLGLGRGRFY